MINTNTKLLQESIVATSVAIIFGGSIQLIQLIPSNSLRILLLSSSVGVGGGIGTVFANKNRKSISTLEEQIKRNTEIQIQQLLKNELPSHFQIIQNEINDIDNNFNNIKNELQIIEQNNIIKIDNLNDKLKIIDDFLSTIEQNLISKIKTEYDSYNIEKEKIEHDILEVDEKLNIFIEKSNRDYQSITSKVTNSTKIINDIKKRLKIIESENNTIVRLLNNKQIKITPNFNLSPTKNNWNSTEDKLVMYLGNNYINLAKSHRKSLENIQQNGELEFSFKDGNQTDIQRNTQFYSMLRDAGFLEKYEYKNKVMRIIIKQKKDFKKFTSGDWFERFIFNKVTALFKEHKLQSESLVNPEVVFSNGDRFELDLLFWVKEHLFWIECKAGMQFDRDFPKYSENHQQFLQLPKTHALVVCLNIDDATAANRTALWSNITVTNPDSLLRSIRSVLNI